MRGSDELRQTCGYLLFNGINSFTAAFELLRNGYRLQPGILVRNILETLSTILHLFILPDDLKLFKQGNLKSTKTLDAAKKVIPPFGQLYGFFSDGFVHISSLYQNFQPLIPFKSKEDEALKVNVGFMKISIWLIYVTTELIFLDIIKAPRYWRKLGGGKYLYSPSREEHSRQSEFFGFDLKDKGGNSV